MGWFFICFTCHRDDKIKRCFKEKKNLWYDKQRERDYPTLVTSGLKEDNDNTILIIWTSKDPISQTLGI